MPEEDEDEYDYEQDEVNVDSDDKTRKFSSASSSRVTNDKETGQKVQPSKMKTPLYSPTIFSPISSPKTSLNISSPKPDGQCRNEGPSLLRLKSNRLTDSAAATSLPVSPPMSNDCSISSDSDGEVIVWPTSPLLIC